ncbi:IS3 family transposase [Ensifer sp. SL37]|uniref:IS3 family transposase n=1 Tax=Ensifer sp. SL37 TaxID=2995137 RepID=UPI003FA3DCD3
MSRRPRRNHSAAFKARVALAAIQGEKTLSELAQQYDVHANQITTWRDQALAGMTAIFDTGSKPSEPAVDVKTLHAKIGELSLENGFFIRRAHQGGTVGERKEMIDRDHELSITRQARALGISRSIVYYLPQPASPADLALMRRIDELHLDYPFAGSRMLQKLLTREGVDVYRLHVRTLMKRMGIAALYRKPRTSAPGDGHKIYPYLLRALKVDRPNQVWATDLTYIPMARGFCYLIAIIDWFTRKVLSWRLSITMDAAPCVEALEEALACYGKPEIFNSDQGSQFTSHDFTKVLLDHKIKISMDGKGAWRDNVFVERLWRSVKYEEVYLKAYDSVRQARASIGKYLDFYNQRRPHSSLDGKTPDEAYLTPTPLPEAA